MTRRASAGSSVVVAAQFYQNGVLADPFQIVDVSIYDAPTGGTAISTALPTTSPATGTLNATWAIPSGLPSGTYYDRWTVVNVSGEAQQIIGGTRYAIEVLSDGTPKRTTALLEIKAILEGITISNGFNTDIKTVEPFLRTRDDVTDGERPYLAFGFDRATYEHYADKEMRISQPWTVVGYLDTRRDDWTDASAKINYLIDDVIAAVMGAPELNNGTLTQTIPIDDLTDEADPDREDGSAVVINFASIYHRDNKAS